MNKRKYGLTLVMAGFAFLVLYFLLPAPSLLWGGAITLSIVFHIAGTANLMKFIQTKKEEEEDL